MSSGALEIVLEFARAEQTDDPFAFRFGSQAYLMPTPRGGGGYGRSELVWDSARLARLQAVRRPGRDPALVQEIGEQGPVHADAPPDVAGVARCIARVRPLSYCHDHR